MTKQQICVLPLTAWLQLQSLQWEAQAWNYSEVTAPTRILPDGNLKKDCWLLLRCIAHLFRVITRCKTKNKPFSFDPLQLESAHDNPECVSGYSILKLPQFSFKTHVSHLTYENANEDKTCQRTLASINLSQLLTVCILLGGKKSFTEFGMAQQWHCAVLFWLFNNLFKNPFWSWQLRSL